MGESDPPYRSNSPQAVAEMLRAGIRDALAEQRCDVVGFSFGGLIGGFLALLEPASVRSLTIVGTTGWRGVRTNQIDLRLVRGLQPDEQWAAHRENLQRIMIADAEAIDDDAIWIQAWHAVHARVNTREFYKKGSLQDVIPRLKVPINAIWGELDAIAWPHVREREDLLHDLNPNVQFRQIPQAGHWVAYERAEEFNRVLLELLSRTPRESVRSRLAP